jgi:DNA-binding MarR family transcriptional regulator
MAEEVLEQRAAFLIGAIANKVVNAGAAACRRGGDIGFTEWRSMVVLALEPAAAKRICEVTGLDKAAISRSLKALEQRGLIAPTLATSARRSRAWLLTDEGRGVYERLLPAAREHERVLLADLTPEEAQTLLALLRRLHAAVPALEG